MTWDPSTLPEIDGLTMGILGGTGDQGRGLAYRFARAGLRVIIGSRTVERAVAAAADLAAMPGAEGADLGAIGGAANEDCARSSDVVIVAVPWDGHAETLSCVRDGLAGKIVVDCVNPLGFDTKGPYAVRVVEGSAAEQAESLLPQSRVCAAFHHVSASVMIDPSIKEVDLDVMVLGDDREAVAVVMALATRVEGMRGIHAGRLRNAGQVEAITANLIAINRRYKAHAGLRVTDL